MSTDLALSSPSGTLATGSSFVIPAVVADAGEKAAERFIEFFTATIRNAHTRRAYGLAVADFFGWCHRHHLSLPAIKPKHVAAYVEHLRQRPDRPLAAPSIKQHLAAISRCLNWLTTGGNLDFNPAASVRGPKHVVKKGKTPVLTADQAESCSPASRSGSARRPKTARTIPARPA